MRYEKLSDYANRMGIKYQTAWLWFKNNKIPGAIKHNGTILVPIEETNKQKQENLAATYARVSSSQNKKNLETQNQRLYEYATAKGYQITTQVKEIGSGVNDSRKKTHYTIQR